MTPQRQTYRTLTKDAVKSVADWLIKENTAATTLDIKLELRKHGFWAQQHQVSQFMIDLESEGLYTFTSNGIYRTYFAAPNPRPSKASTFSGGNRNYTCSIKGICETTYYSQTRSQARYSFVRENWKIYAEAHYLNMGDCFSHPKTRSAVSPARIKRQMYGECRAVVAWDNVS